MCSIFDFISSGEVPYINIEPIKSRVFEWSGGFIPGRVVVNGKLDRRIGALIDDEGSRYVVFDLDVDEVMEEDIEDIEEDEEDEDGDGEEIEDGEDGDDDESGGELGGTDDDEPMGESDMDISTIN